MKTWKDVEKLIAKQDNIIKTQKEIISKQKELIKVDAEIIASLKKIIALQGALTENEITSQEQEYISNDVIAVKEVLLRKEQTNEKTEN